MSFRVDTDIPYGNACAIQVTSDASGTDVHFAADPHGGPESLWFCARVSRAGDTVPAPARFRLVLEHVENMLGAAARPHMLQPVVRRPGGDWERLPLGEVETSPDGRARVCWTVRAPAPSLEVALCFPYGEPDLQALALDLGAPWRLDTIGVSQGGRPIRRLSNGPGHAEGTRPGVYFVGRQHSGETPGSWVLQGVVRRLAEAGDDGPLVWAVPLSNPDGVAEGDYGKDNYPYDLNRAWGLPPMRHETLVIQRDCRRWLERCRPLLGLDFHAPGACETEGCYFFLPNPEALPEFHKEGKAWADRLAAAIGEGFLRPDPARVAAYRSRWNTHSFTQFCCTSLELCGLTLEVPYSSINDTPLTREVYGTIGRRLAEGLLQAC